MQAVRYVRLYADEHGESHFEDLEIELAPVDFAPPAAPLDVAEFQSAINSHLIGVPSDWRGDTPHPAPRRQVLCTLQGEYQVTASDGNVRSFPVGSILLVEDTWGKGHSTRNTGENDALLFATTLDDS